MVIKRRVSKAVLSAGIVLLILSLVAGSILGCAPKAPAQHETVQIHIHGGGPGSPAQVMSFAWSDLINKYHPWLRSTVSEEAAAGAAIPLYVKTPEIRKNHIICFFSGQPEAWSMGLPPLDTKYTSWKIIAHAVSTPLIMLTFDPKIKTVYDLAGKRVGIVPRVQPTGMVMMNIFKHGAGVLDKIQKIEDLQPAAAKDALITGQVDAAEFPFSCDAPNWIIPAYAQEVIATGKKVYFVDYTKEAQEKAYEKEPWPYLNILHVPAGAYASDQPAFWAHYPLTAWACDTAMPEEVVYEAVKIIYEHIGEFANYHATGKNMAIARLGELGGSQSEKDVHPGALKFYKEKGIKVGPPAR